MKKKMMGLLLAIVITLTGCGNKATETDQSVAASRESTQTIEETQGTEETQEATGETREASKGLGTGTKESPASGTEQTKPSGGAGSSQASAADSSAKNTAASKSSQESKAESSKPSGSQTAASKPAAGTNTGSTKPTSGSTTGNTGNDQGGASTPKPSHTTCTWDGGKVTSGATCNSEGVKTYTCTVCGKTKTEGIAKTAHNYVSETTQPTCTEAGKVKTTCSICGSVQSEKAGAAATGHKMTDSWFGDPPTCYKGGYLNRYCTVCDFLETSTSVPPLAHVVVDTEVQHGNCREFTVIRHTCSVCGIQVKEDTSYLETNDHNWADGMSDPVWSEEAGDFVSSPIEYCTRCNDSHYK